MKNKLAAILLLLFGLVPVLICRDGTALVIFGIAAITLFFAKKDYTKGPYEEDISHE
jgi:glutathione S-transferase